MIVFIDTEAISSFFSDLLKEQVKQDMKYSQELKKYEYEKQKLKEQKRLEKMKKELFNLRFQHAINQLENPQKIVEARKTIARLLTVIREKEIQADKDSAQ